MALSLPVDGVIDELMAALEQRGSAVLQAEPGAGKTTVVPLHLLQQEWLAGQRILMLEPRRIAARAAAHRLASGRGEEVGDTVGFVTRDERRVGPNTRLEVVTEGILTRRLQRDPSLDGVGLVVFDEFHERNLQGDLGLTLALDARDGLRPDLRVLVMSATLDVVRVAEVIGGDQPSPIVSSPGRSYPIDIAWQPRRPKDPLEPAITTAVLKALDADGDVLVFLPGVGEILRSQRHLADALTGRDDIDIRPLYGGLSAVDQDAAIAPAGPGMRKVVLATDVAETSLTVVGVSAVVDAGLAREPRFDVRTGMTRLVTTAASRASVDQRAGRAGRLGPGRVIRLWSKVEQASRPRHRAAEITTVDLAGLVLELALWGIHDPDALTWMDRPPARSWDEGAALLTMLGALDADGALTIDGRAMARLPLHPRLSRMVVAGAQWGAGWTSCVVAALLSDRDILRGRRDEIPVDLGERALLIDDHTRRHQAADGRAIARARREAKDLARRAGIDDRGLDPGAIGRVLALGYPDRVAQRRGAAPGRFRMRNGSGVWLPDTDPVAHEGFIVAADVDGKRKDARVRLAAGLDEDELGALFSPEIEEHAGLTWDRDRNDLVRRVERRLGSLRLSAVEGPPEPDDEVTAALVDRVRSVGIDVLGWNDDARAFQARLSFVHAHRPGWPDVSDKALRSSLDDWLPDLLPAATGRADLERLDMLVVLQTLLSWDQLTELNTLAPTHVDVASGRPIPLDYTVDPPVLRVRVQRLFGVATTPTVLEGQLAVAVHLLSPADRPIQVTSDLEGFWQGSWHDVRKDMAGRYPKHNWPENPLT